jgi:hypothetical protein
MAIAVSAWWWVMKLLSGSLEATVVFNFVSGPSVLFYTLTVPTHFGLKCNLTLHVEHSFLGDVNRLCRIMFVRFYFELRFYPNFSHILIWVHRTNCCAVDLYNHMNREYNKMWFIEVLLTSFSRTAHYKISRSTLIFREPRISKNTTTQVLSLLVFWIVITCGVEDDYQHFREMYWPNLHCDAVALYSRIPPLKYTQYKGINLSCSALLLAFMWTLFLVFFIWEQLFSVG